MVLAVKGLGKLSWMVFAHLLLVQRVQLIQRTCMNETLYRWTFNFHKVVRKQNSGVVEDFILPYSAVYLQIQKWKNYWNLSIFAKVIIKIKVARFLWPTVYNCMYVCFWNHLAAYHASKLNILLFCTTFTHQLCQALRHAAAFLLNCRLHLCLLRYIHKKTQRASLRLLAPLKALSKWC